MIRQARPRAMGLSIRPMRWRVPGSGRPVSHTLFMGPGRPGPRRFPSRPCGDILTIMFGDGALSFREHVMREPLPLATVHDAVLDFLHGRDDAALFGAQAVNAYV